MIIILIVIILLGGCTGITQYNADLPGDKRVIYVMGVNKSPIGGTDLRICDRWVYSNNTGELKLERSDSSAVESKSILDSLKGLPIPLVVP